MDEKKQKHLEFIQNTITRMATNSFYLKGWAVTLIAALFAISLKEQDCKIFLVCMLPTLVFWILDSYYLRLERLYCTLYDGVRVEDEDDIDYSMNTKKYNEKVDSLICIVFSKTEFPFYAIIMTLLGIAFLFWK